MVCKALNSCYLYADSTSLSCYCAMIVQQVTAHATILLFDHNDYTSSLSSHSTISSFSPQHYTLYSSYDMTFSPRTYFTSSRTCTTNNTHWVQVPPPEVGSWTPRFQISIPFGGRNVPTLFQLQLAISSRLSEYS